MPWKKRKLRSSKSLKRRMKSIVEWTGDIAIGLLLLVITWGLINFFIR
ncbi:MAG: hypothetical protein ACYCX4_14620 [Bacillota bacterium]